MARTLDVRSFGAGDGGTVNSEVAFRKAASALVAGDTLNIQGTYLLKDVVPITVNNVTIRGGGVILYPADGSWVGATYCELFQVTGENVKFNDLTFDGQNGIPSAGKDWWPIRFGLSGNGGSEGKVSGCTFRNFKKQVGGHAGAPIGFVGSSAIDGQVLGCTFDTTHAGVFSQAARTVINDNSFKAAGDVVVAFNGVDCVGASAIGNTINNAGDYAAFAVEEGASEYKIEGNTIINCGAAYQEYSAAVLTAKQGGSFSNNGIWINDSFAGLTSPSLIRLNQYYQQTVIKNNQVRYDLGALALADSPYAIYSTGLYDHTIAGNRFYFRSVSAKGIVVIAGSGNGRIWRNQFDLADVCPAGIEFGASMVGRVDVDHNEFSGPHSWAVVWDAGHTWTGILRDNTWVPPAGAWYCYYGSPFGNLSIDGATNPNDPQPGSRHTLSNLASCLSEIQGGATSAAPSVGAWKVGDVVRNSAPASAGYIGLACTVAGTPGTWKTFGLIS